jgi:defect-in-organelle-trafficking protein DotC
MALTGAAAHAQASSAQGFDAVREALKAPAAGPAIPFVRKSVLAESAQLVGARSGLSTRSCQLLTVIAEGRASLDRKYRFSDLMMGAGVLPPVIDEARDNVALDAVVMRVAARVYRISEAARLVDIPPTWRDWLMVGLPPDACEFRAADATASQATEVLPTNEAERAFWLAESRKAYDAGVAQANDVYDGNLARLDRAYKGMRRYFDLYSAGMVSAPVIVSSTDVVMREDPNTLIVGNTIIRITVPTDFVEKTEKWRPLVQ